MSYILEALKKSDQQRQRGATPTIPSSSAMPVASKRSVSVYYGLPAAVLLCAGIAIGWLRPWQAEQPERAVAPVVVRQAFPNPSQTLLTPRAEQAEIAGKAAPQLPTYDPTPIVQAADATQANDPAPAMARAEQSAPPISPSEPATPANAEQKVVLMSELPLAIQQEIPAMTIQLHSYSNKSIYSLVSINSRMLKEGESISPGLKLEQITPDGVILNYKGYRFQHGIR